MTDHPFDKIAVEAAREAVKAIIDRQANTLEDITDLIVPAALTAACKSMKERGKATNGDYVPSGENGAGYSNMGSLDFWRGIFNFTIFRHGE